MTKPNPTANLIRWFLFFVAINYSINVAAQCSGTSTTITICDKYSDSNNQNFDLFTPLTGESPGGTWSTTDPANYFALNASTGILNLWRIHSAGTHVFTYTNCGETSTITIDLGGYSGENNVIGDANACSDNPSVNLNPFLGDQVNDILPDINGVWEEDPSSITGHLSGNLFNAEEAGPGIYTFTYTVSTVGICPEHSSTIILKVYPRASSGVANDLILCNNEDFSVYTNVNLNNLLTEEDTQGTWSDNNSTNQLSDLSDTFIDVQQIYTDFGVGRYSFSYTVFPTPYHPVCEESTTTVNIIILPTLDGAMQADNYCTTQDTYPVTITYDSTLFPNGTYTINYSLSGVMETETISAIFNNGTATFDINKNIAPTNTKVVLDIVSMPNVCPNILVPSASFLISAPQTSVTDACVNTDVTVSLSTIFNDAEVLTNEMHTVNYTITNPDNVATQLTENVTFTTGAGSFVIPGTNFPIGGIYDISVSIVNGLDLGCSLTTSTEITPTPSEIELDLLVDNNCDATNIDVLIDAPTLANGSYSITYDVMDQLTNNILTQNSINFVGGTASYQIDAGGFPQGNYTVSIRSIQDDTTPCRIKFEYELEENFARGGIPNVPIATALQNFCLNDFNTSEPTLEDIEVTAEGTILFYETATDTNILPITTSLVDGEDYFISNTDINNNCESSARIQVVTTLSNPIIPSTTIINPEYCEEDNTTLSVLTQDIFNDTSIAWYDSQIGGNQLDNSTILQNNNSYFASTTSVEGCHGTERLEIIPVVHSLEPASIEFTTLSLCGLEQPTIQNLQVLENANGYEIQWFDTTEGGTPLNLTDILIADTTYYAESYNPLTSCRNPQRMAVTVSLSNCDPEQHDFFIPDGFSPNGDSTNETYFIPKIETIFPEFTLEIINRYGNTMFVGDINNPAWDGSINGKSIAPNGVYFYIVNYHKDGYSPVQGRLYLNR